MFSKYKTRKVFLTKNTARKEVDIKVGKKGGFNKNDYKSFTRINTSNIPFAIEVLKELYVAYNFESDVGVANLIKYEFECDCTVEQVREARGYYTDVEEDDKNIYKNCVV